MPRKYDKYMNPLPGFKKDPEKAKEAADRFAEAKEKRAQKRRFRLFQVEPEELKVLEAMERLPEGVRQDAAEGLLIARVAKRKKLTLKK